MSEPWLRLTPGGDLMLAVRAQPGAHKTEIAGVQGDALKLRLAAPAVAGKANACLIAFLAEQLEVGRSAIELVSGATGRRKLMRVRGVSIQGVEALRRAADQRPASKTKRPSTRV